MKNLRMQAFIMAMIALLSSSLVKAEDLGSTTTVSPQPEWLRNAVIYEANLRQGNMERSIKGLQKELPRLRDLGVDVIWLMPIHPISEKNRKGTLGSYYAVKDYKAVNPELGSLTDMKEFVNTAHKFGMKVIIDEVCNHTGCDNIWVEQHPEFYALNEKGEMYGLHDWTDTYKLDYSNPELRAAMIDALKFWVDETDIDGFRFDLAGDVPTDFWVEARNAVQQVKPVLFLAESSKPELQSEAFDMDYAWPMKDLFNALAASKGVNKYAVEHSQNLPGKNAKDIPALLANQEKEYPAGAVHMNMITNHDLNAWEGTEFDRFGPATGAFAILSYTLPGVPMMYTGQEVGMDHPFDFFEYDVIPDYTPNEYTTFYEMLNALRHNNSAFDAGRDFAGDFEVIPTQNDDVLVFARTKGNDKAIVIVNLSNEASPLVFTGAAPDITGLDSYFSVNMESLPATLAPWEYIVLTSPIE